MVSIDNPALFVVLVIVILVFVKLEPKQVYLLLRWIIRLPTRLNTEKLTELLRRVVEIFKGD